MENENTIQLPIPAPVVEQTPPVSPTPPKSSISRLMILVILFAVIAIVGIGVYALGTKTQTPQVIKPTPLAVIQPTPPDPTANWKTYTHPIYKYEFKYSNLWRLIYLPPRPDIPEATDRDEVLLQITDVGQINISVQSLSNTSATLENEARFRGKTIKGEGIVRISSTKYLTSYYNIVNQFNKRIIMIPIPGNFTKFIEIESSLEEFTHYIDQILSTFKFLPSSPPDAMSDEPKNIGTYEGVPIAP